MLKKRGFSGLSMTGNSDISDFVCWKAHRGLLGNGFSLFCPENRGVSRGGVMYRSALPMDQIKRHSI
jgi:hypothetical protein